MLQVAVATTQRCGNAGSLHTLEGYVDCVQPNADLYGFSGNLLVERGETGGLKEISASSTSLTRSCLMPRGAVLRNTPSCWGVVVYTGADTKLARNSVPARSKTSSVERRINQGIALIFVALLALCTASVVIENAIGTNLFQRDGVSADLANGTTSFDSIASGVHGGHWYIPYAYEGGEHAYGTPSWSSWITFLLLYNTLWPISLYVALEICKVVQAWSMENDALMY